MRRSHLASTPPLAPRTVKAERMALVLSLLSQAAYSLDDERLAAQLGLPRAMALLKERLSHETAPGKLAGWQTQRLTTHVETHLQDRIRTADLAAIVRLSVGHFTHAFKMTFGETPCHYVLRQRIRQAQTLMQHQRTPLTDIALACGFCDQSHFSRLFRRVTGTSPSEWRRRFGDDAVPVLDSATPVTGAVTGPRMTSVAFAAEDHLGGNRKLPCRPSPSRESTSLSSFSATPEAPSTWASRIR